jgi:hypothetical protein
MTIHAWICIFLVFLGTLFLGKYLVSFEPPPGPYSHPHIQAPIYIIPPGCTVKKYQFGDKIDKACASDEYEFYDGMKFGLTMAKGSPYYRVGNDLVSIHCWMGSCQTGVRYGDSYYQ